MDRRSRQAGVTLLELVIVTGTMAVVAGAMYALLGSGAKTYAAGATKSDLDHRVHAVLEKAAEALLYAGQLVIEPSPAPPLSTHHITFQESAGFAGGTALWREPVILELIYDSSEQNDGKDNDGNGLVDEGVLVMKDQPASGPARVTILTRWVREYLEGEVPDGTDNNGNGLIDERGFCVDRSQDVWTLRLTLERPDGSGRIIRSTAATCVTPRN